MDTFKEGLLREHADLRLCKTSHPLTFTGQWEELLFAGFLDEGREDVDYLLLRECDRVLIFSDCGNFVAEIDIPEDF